MRMRVVSARIGLLLITGMMVFGPSSVRSRAVEPLPQDSGAPGVWQKIRKLQTTASLLHTTAHPDDEHGGMLALMSRGQGARTALLTLTRGESGDNAIGSELFDALGLIRTEELIVANRYYGVDEQYFTSVADYGFSKRLDEALDNWNREATLAEVVRIIRMERPLVIVSRFSGTPRDGHGQHQAAGVLTQEAFRAAADPKRFPEQFEEGLRPWQALKLFAGARSARRLVGRDRSRRLRSGARHVVSVLRAPRPQLPALAERRPLRAPARRRARLLRAHHRAAARRDARDRRRHGPTQHGQRDAARRPARPRPAPARTRPSRSRSRMPRTPPMAAPPARTRTPPSPPTSAPPTAAGPLASVPPGAKETGFFDGIDVTLSGIYRTLGVKEPAGRESAARDDRAARAAGRRLLQHDEPGRLRAGARARVDGDARGAGEVLGRRGSGARAAAEGTSVRRRADLGARRHRVGPRRSGERPHRRPAESLALRPLVAGQTFGVRASFVASGPSTITLRALDLVTAPGWTYKGGNPGLASRLVENRPVIQRFEVTVPAGALPTRSLLTRESPDVPRYQPGGPERHRPWTAPPVLVRAEFEFDHTIVEVTGPVQRREGELPDGFAMRELTLVPALSLNVTPAQAIIAHRQRPQKPIPVTVDITNNSQSRESNGTLAITLPQDWRADPATHAFKLARVSRRASRFRSRRPP